MRIGGFQKTSLIEFPGKVSSIIFTMGCNLKCPFCYVPQLVVPEKMKSVDQIPENYIFQYLEKNRKFIDAVVLTGGEPTIHPDLADFIRKIKSIGFLIGLETNGTNSNMLSELIKNRLLDYVAMDVKTRLSFDKYNQIVGGVLTEELFNNIVRSINLLLSSSIAYEFRTTLIRELHRNDDIIEICKSVKSARVYYIQNFRKTNGVIGGKNFTPFKQEEIDVIISEGKKFVNILYRG